MPDAKPISQSVDLRCSFEAASHLPSCKQRVFLRSSQHLSKEGMASINQHNWERTRLNGASKSYIANSSGDILTVGFNRFDICLQQANITLLVAKAYWLQCLIN